MLGDDCRERRRGASLLSLPNELLQKMLVAHGCGAGIKALRTVCKTFSELIASSTSTISAIGCRQDVLGALAAFPNATRVILDASAPCPDPAAQETALLDAMSALASTPTPIRSAITSLSVLHLSCSVPPAARLPHLSASLTELELSDCSYTHAVEQGAVNVLLQHPHDILDRSDAMVDFALAMPHLRRLSLSCAAFSADSLLRLASLSQLESLSIAGAMTCMEGPAGAAAAYRALLAALPKLRQLRLPMAVDAPCCVRRWDDSSDSEGEGDGEGEEDGRGEEEGGAGAHGGWRREQRGEGHGRDSDSDGGSEASDETAVPPAIGSSSSNSGIRAASSVAPHASLEQPDRPAVTSPFSSAQGWAACLPAPGPSALLHVACGNAGQPPRAASAPAIVTRAVTSARRRATGVYKQLKQQRRLRLLSRLPPPSAWVFPPGLADLTIPLCSMNRPVFEAVCAAYGTGTGGAVRIGSQVVPSAGQLTALHLPALGGYTHWDGSFLQTPRDFEALSCLTSLRLLHVALEPAALRPGATQRDTLRGCFTRLRALKLLQDLRITEAPQPVCFAMRKSRLPPPAASAPHHLWSLSSPASGPNHPWSAPAASLHASPRPVLPHLSYDTLLQLRRQWPDLQHLHFFSQVAHSDDFAHAAAAAAAAPSASQWGSAAAPGPLPFTPSAGCSRQGPGAMVVAAAATAAGAGWCERESEELARALLPPGLRGDCVCCSGPHMVAVLAGCVGGWGPAGRRRL